MAANFVESVMNQVQSSGFPSFRQTERDYQRSILRMRARTLEEKVDWMEGLLRQPRAIGGEDKVAMIYGMAGDLYPRDPESGNFMIELLMDSLRKIQAEKEAMA